MACLRSWRSHNGLPLKLKRSQCNGLPCWWDAPWYGWSSNCRNHSFTPFPPSSESFCTLIPIFHLNFFLVYLSNILAVYDLTFLSILMKILGRIPKGWMSQKCCICTYIVFLVLYNMRKAHPSLPWMLLLMLMESVSFSLGAGYPMYHNTAETNTRKKEIRIQLQKLAMPLQNREND